MSAYLDALTQCLWLIVMCALIAGGAAYVVSKLEHPVYRASAVLVVDESHSGQDLYNSFLASEQFATLYTQLAKQPIVLDQAARGLGNISAAALANQISAAGLTGSPMFQIQADASSPTEAARIANSVAEALVAVVDEQGPGGANIVHIFQPALPPTSPDHPQALKNAVIGAALGLVLAAVFVLLMETLRGRVRTAEQVEQTTGLSTVGAVPDVSTNDLLAEWRDNGDLRDSLRMLRMSLYPRSDHIANEHRQRVLAVTSAEPAEGKTLVAAALAIAVARSGKRVLLIDADLHQPSVHERLGLPRSPGLVAYLEGTDAEPQLETLTEVSHLWVLPAGDGAAAEHATELLGSERMHLLLRHPPEHGSTRKNHLRQRDSRADGGSNGRLARSSQSRAASLAARQGTAEVLVDAVNQPPTPQAADVIVLDLPPLLASADAAILSAEADGVLVVADTIRSRLCALNDAQQVLGQVGARVLGVVLNRASNTRGRVYYRAGARSRPLTSSSDALSPPASQAVQNPAGPVETG